MADTPPTRVTVDPPLRAWRLAATERRGMHAHRAELAPLLDTLRLHTTPFDPKRPIIATGHQAWFWHPGILAKDLAMAGACKRLDAQPVHLVVDHVANPALRIDVPMRRGGALLVEPLRLEDEDLSLGTGSRPPLSRRALAEAIHHLGASVEGEIAVDLGRLLDTPPGFDQCKTLADSITAMQLHAVRDLCPGVFVLRTSRLARLASFAALAERMLHDARACVAAYNRAAAAVPGAGVALLTVERDRVELPLWVVGPGGALGRAYADLADTTPLLTGADGTPIEPVADDGAEHLPLAPRALTLTAFMRSTLCDLFIHGTGGGVYERVTEAWWRHWVGEPLAPLSVVSADVTLGLEVPVATRAEVDRAVWFRHHLPHNIDRFAQGSSTLDAALVAEKRALLAGDPADHDADARRAARRRLRSINRALADAHPALLAEADAAVDRARRGVANAATARRRDWCFQLYPPATLAGLRQTLLDSA